MSTDNETSQLCFPLQGPIPDSEVLIVRDLDVVGVGSLRRQQIEELQKTKQFILQTYEDLISDSVLEIYRAELLRTLQWLRPLQSVIGSDLDLEEEHKKMFARIFPRTQKALGFTGNKICTAYLQEMDWSSWLLQDHWRYFVGFLRGKFPEKKEILELAHWEWEQAWLEVQPFDTEVLESGLISTSTSLQIVTLTTNNSYLARDAGMYGLAYKKNAKNISERTLDIYEAKLLDLLHEDRKYTEDQLIEAAMISEGLPEALDKSRWQNKVQALADGGFLVR
ncbi:hypothetical protein [Bdellovibrio reynosensis]|uniref:DNA-binding domain-containing protein n=1 Tax=Bdellovibrio reynosensis TaxID=2835041 RepID=A0ABY4CB04_9BACT|nr:hypothetical protein [Bdellovibrio reynosensis]UOF02153.1 hypothetical protein MNR06_04185 [Bdellovibrio reynosensis]